MGLGLSDSGHVRRLVRRLIGYERKSRMKEAGIRTHFIVGIGAGVILFILAAQSYSIAGFISLLLRLRGK